ncbi:Alpha/Beta hydrolase protein [Apiosordaria backusii]|uniref:Alpha/Beta hydrolase protein n=1 Tax=Apiosordaria backusii TaxID=314023 RepID=A0AA40BSW8_9PEZI|nr:Alpha/Beta hydrolase protein [Apiosordaria backusii]
MADTGGGTPAADGVKPYKIHVPTRHLNLARQKLELTRLPHEGSFPKSTEWWEPKPVIEPLIDYWLEKYNFRDIESHLNATIPQFRTSIALSESQSPLRIHFIHARSSSADALPLLVLPPFPLTNLSISHLINPLTTPTDATHQSFHVVIPSFPGLGFSDSLPVNLSPVTATASIFNTLMTSRLGYTHYLTTTTSPGSSSPAQIDFLLAHAISTTYSDFCLATHLISPVLSPPKISTSPLEFAKWSLAWFFRGGVAGYEERDFLGYYSSPSSSVPNTDIKDPNTLAYGLCDSPVGMLAFVLRHLKQNSSNSVIGARGTFTKEELITLTNLAWLPGPEGLLRFWSGTSLHHPAAAAHHHQPPARSSQTKKPKVGVTVFASSYSTTTATTETTVQEKETGEELDLSSLGGKPDNGRPKAKFYPPAWAHSSYTVLHTTRIDSHPPTSLLPFESPEVISSGIRSLAAELLKTDKRIIPVAPLTGIVIDSAPPPITAPATVSTQPKPEKTTIKPVVSEPPIILRTIKEEKLDVDQERDQAKGKGIERVDESLLSPPPAIPVGVVKRELSDGSGDMGSPDTLVGDSSPSPSPLGRS